MLCLHRWARKVNGLSTLSYRTCCPYALNPLYATAGAKLHGIIECDEFSHTPCGDPMFSVWGGENIAMGFASVRATFQAWLDSPGHRSNILDPAWRWYGSATAEHNRARIWVVHFAAQVAQ